MLCVFFVPLRYAVCPLHAFQVCCLSFPYLHDIPVMLCDFFLVDLHCMCCSSKCVIAKYFVMLLVQRDPEMRLLRLFETSGISYPLTQCHIPENCNSDRAKSL
jgi:hypothetical protein